MPQGGASVHKKDTAARSAPLLLTAKNNLHGFQPTISSFNPNGLTTYGFAIIGFASCRQAPLCVLFNQQSVARHLRRKVVNIFFRHCYYFFSAFFSRQNEYVTIALIANAPEIDRLRHFRR